MKQHRRIMAQVIVALFGIALLALGCMGIIEEFWSGMGMALVTVSVLRTIRMIRFRKDEGYREKMEIEASDERNQFIRSKAWAWAGYMFVLILAVLAIALRVMGEAVLSVAAGFGVCLLALLYWIAYLLLQKKY